MSIDLTWTNLPDDPSLATRVADLARLADDADGIAPLSEQFLLGLNDARLGHRHLLAIDTDNESIVGVAAVADNEAEFVVTPERRREGIGQRIYAELTEHVDSLRAWSHGNGPGAQALAARNGLTVVRRLLVMEIAGEALAEYMDFSAPPGTRELSLAESVPEIADSQTVHQAWLKANNEAFAWHPEQGGWDMERLLRGKEAEWFLDEDVRFLWDETNQGGEHGAPMIGFHWTKRHDDTTGEIYVVGLADAYRGKGMGGPVVAMGLTHLVAVGMHRVILYVEDDNEAAVARYRADGFTVAEEHVVYEAKTNEG